MPEVSSPLKNKDDAEEIFDDNRFGHFETAQDKKGLLVQGYERATPDHFLNTRKNHTTYDSWFAGITEEKIAETPNNDILIYGTPKSQVCARLESGVSVILDIEVQGAAQVKQKLPEAVTVFLAPPGLDALERRLRGRGTESEETIRARLDTARREMALAPSYDYTVINDDPDRASRELGAILDK